MQKLLFPQRLTMDNIARMIVKSIKDGFIEFKQDFFKQEDL